MYLEIVARMTRRKGSKEMDGSKRKKRIRLVISQESVLGVDLKMRASNQFRNFPVKVRAKKENTRGMGLGEIE
jgi:hypothetical protein